MTLTTTKRMTAALAVLALLLVFSALAEESPAGEGAGEGHGQEFETFLWIAVILVFAKLSSLVEKWGQPAVLGELVMGMAIGNLALLGISVFEPIKQDSIIMFLSELGVVILLFQIGLESNIAEMMKVGLRSALVATVGVVLPFFLGTWVVGPLLLPGLSFNAYLFLGATLTATSVGITARVFRDLGKLNTKEARIVLGAAVIDDVLGLIILAIVSAIVTTGNVSIGGIGTIFLKALVFLAGSIVLGQLFAPRISRWFSRIHTGVGMKFTLAISFGLVFAYLADVIGLAPIVGAFAAGLVLDPVHFRHFKEPEIVEAVNEAIKKSRVKNAEEIKKVIRKHSDRHIEELIEPVSMFLVPIFFVVTGIAVRLDTLFDLKAMGIALAITAVAVIGKVLAGAVAGKVKKSIVGWGMVPRGEVGLIFASIGRTLGVVSDTVFSIIVIVVILTTLVTPPVLNYYLKKG